MFATCAPGKALEVHNPNPNPVASAQELCGGAAHLGDVAFAELWDFLLHVFDKG